MKKTLLAYPGATEFPADDPRTTARRREIIRDKPSLRGVYREWYALIAAAVDQRRRVLELGSGPGFLRDELPRTISSECFWIPGVDLACDARELPFRDRSIEAIVLVDVFHHVSNVRSFFGEAVRVLRPGGRVVMIEPWRTTWSRLIYSHFHDEPFAPEAAWEFESSGPLSGANNALPWIVFSRDRALFEREFPALRIVTVRPMMPFRYLLTGGVSRIALGPAPLFPLIRGFERMLAPCMNSLAMFALIVLERA